MPRRAPNLPHLQNPRNLQGLRKAPVEITLLPKWFPIHLSKISYWARTVIVPLLVLRKLKPRARNPRGVTIDELFAQPPATITKLARGAHQKEPWASFFFALEHIGGFGGVADRVACARRELREDFLHLRPAPLSQVKFAQPQAGDGEVRLFRQHSQPLRLGLHQAILIAVQHGQVMAGLVTAQARVVSLSRYAATSPANSA